MKKLLLMPMLACSLLCYSQAVLSDPVCNGPELLDAVTNSQSVLLHWKLVEDVTEYQIAGRVVGAKTWVLFTTTLNSLEIHHLNPGTHYEWGVRAMCASSGWTDWHGSGTFTTKNGPSNSASKDPLVAENNPVITVYPNPGVDAAVIEIYSQSTIADLSLKVLDSFGNLVFSQERKDVNGLIEVKLTTKNLASGIYNVVIIADRFLEKRNLLLQH